MATNTFSDGVIADRHTINSRNAMFAHAIRHNADVDVDVDSPAFEIMEYLIWQFSVDIMNYGTDENKDDLLKVAFDSDMMWDENTRTFVERDGDVDGICGGSIDWDGVKK